SKYYLNHLAYSQPNTEEELYFPSKRHTLSHLELRKIKEHFSVSYNVRSRKLNTFSSFGIKYKRLHTKKGHQNG
ncbi:17912_t:CDS:2, partial [Funneliformis geosporum]